MTFLACAFCCAVAQAEEKTVSEKSAEVWDKTKKKTKEVSKAVVKKTKETVKAIEHKIDTPDADARKVRFGRHRVDRKADGDGRGVDGGRRLRTMPQDLRDFRQRRALANHVRRQAVAEQVSGTATGPWDLRVRESARDDVADD